MKNAHAKAPRHAEKGKAGQAFAAVVSSLGKRDDGVSKAPAGDSSRAQRSLRRTWLGLLD
jgi:hypothetical protein